MWRAIKYILVYFAIQIITMLCVLPIVRSAGEKGLILSIGISLFLNAILVCLYVVKTGEVRLERETFSLRPWTIILPCFLALVFSIPPRFWLIATLDLPNLAGDTFEKAFGSVLGLVSVGILAPIAEEFLFRGAVLSSLLKWKPAEGKPWLAVLLSAVLFSVMHINPAQMPGAFMLGLLLGWICYRTGSLLPGIVIHVLNNSLACIVVALIAASSSSGEEGPETISEMFGSPAVEYLLIIVSALLCAAAVVYLVRMVGRHYPPRELILPQDGQEVSGIHPVTPETAEESIIASQDES